MIIDCFPFYNELDVLEIRLNVLNDVVDKFVLVEASKTQSKIDKPFYFEENKQRYSKFLDKIVHVKVEDYPEEDGWAMENFQRNCIKRGIDTLNLKDDDIIVISDVDEIWDPEVKTFIKQIFAKGHDMFSVVLKYLVFYLNLITLNKIWIGSTFTKFSFFKKSCPQDIRNKKDNIPALGTPLGPSFGWHFGYQGGKELVYQKYLSCIEPFDKKSLPSKDIFFEEFNKRIKDDGSFIFSDDLQNESIKLKKIEDVVLPDFIINNKEKYKHMLL